MKVQDIMNEKSIMSTIDHPFTTKLIKTFQDKTNLYMLVEMCHGETLEDLLLRSPNKILASKTCLFISACVVEALDYLHQYNIGHRDIKPSNITIKDNGYCMLTGFDVGKTLLTYYIYNIHIHQFYLLLKSNLARTFYDGACFSFHGTPFYMAPDILSRKGNLVEIMLMLINVCYNRVYICIVGYDHCVDYWSLGVIIFEMSVGRRPFHEDEEFELLRLITRFDYTVPSSIPEDTNEIIKRLLVKRRKRLGAGPSGASEIKKHEYFDEIDWDALYQMKTKSPIQTANRCYRERQKVLSIPFPLFSKKQQSEVKSSISQHLQALIADF